MKTLAASTGIDGDTVVGVALSIDGKAFNPEQGTYARVGEAKRSSALALLGDWVLDLVEGAFPDRAILADSLDVEQMSIG